MVEDGTVALYAGAVVIGLVHGAEPGHGWPIAATYALNRSHQWARGLVASVLLGLGHLFSSLVVVGVFFLMKSRLDLERIDAPLTVFDVQIGGPVSIVAGLMLVSLGAREYRHGHAHDHGGHGDGDHDHSHGDHSHGHGHGDHSHAPADSQTERGDDHGSGHEGSGLVGRVADARRRAHDVLSTDAADGRSLWGIVWAAFVLGFAHEEEFEIIGLCLGSNRCLELMVAYALAVLAALVALTLVLFAGYRRSEERVGRLAEYFPLVSAAVLVAVGIGFVLGVV